MGASYSLKAAAKVFDAVHIPVCFALLHLPLLLFGQLYQDEYEKMQTHGCKQEFADSGPREEDF